MTAKGMRYMLRWTHYTKNLVLVEGGPHGRRWFHRQFGWFNEMGELDWWHYSAELHKEA